MPTLADLFPGFSSRFIESAGTRYFARIGGSGPPLLLLHGYPQTHVCWHRIAGELARHFTVVALDLKGYGQSDAPAGDGGRIAYAKRTVAAEIVGVMAKLGFDRFHLAGHDRGGRVAYRMALDHPQRVASLAVLDILSTIDVWDGFSAASALKSYHWTFLAQPHPLPETLIRAAPMAFLEHTLASLTPSRSLHVLDPSALDHYRAFFADPARVHATCEDYRAGATTDRDIDAQDRAAGRRIGAPVLVLWGSDYVGKGGRDPLAAWTPWCQHPPEGCEIVSGHFLAEENPKATLAALLPFLQRAAALSS